MGFRRAGCLIIGHWTSIEICKEFAFDSKMNGFILRARVRILIFLLKHFITSQPTIQLFRYNEIREEVRI
jgi:hypothetical protein